MSKKMLMNATQHEESRVAIVEDGTLTEMDIEVAGYEPTKGNIYRAVVVRVESGLQAAFVDYGAGRLGFLQIDEINYKTVKPDYKPGEDGRRPRITELLQRGQELLVQITKEERGTKGAALTTYLSLAGRYMVIMPDSKTRGVSRKAESDAQRKELKKAMSSIDMAEDIGYIVRTAALNQTREELERDYNYLLRLYESIKQLDRKVKAPALLYKESNLIIRSIRDYFTTDMDEVLIDDPQVYKEAREFFKMVMPEQVRLVKRHQEKRPIFSRYQIEDQIETLNKNKVPLPSGGSIVIDPTEALVAIDVNSGKMASEQGVEATATKTNIEAAREVGRQLRLRDLGGLVVIDFIDMRDRRHAREVEKELRKALENDKARVSVGRISQFGLLEMSRQRIKATLADGSYLTCPHCQGAGRLKSPETQAASLLRKIHATAAKGQVSQMDVELPLDVAEYLLNSRREDLVDMERDHKVKIHVHGNRDFLADQLELETIKRDDDKPSQQEYVSPALLPALSETAAEQKEEVATAEDDDNDKKRRRRRRRKPAKTEEPQNTEVVSKTEQNATPKDPDMKDAGTSSETPTAAETPVSTEEQAEPQSQANKRRGRPAKKNKSADQKKTAEHEETPAPDTDSPSADQEKPKQRRPRRAPRKPGASQNNTPQPDAETGTSEDESVASQEQQEPPSPAGKETGQPSEPGEKASSEIASSSEKTSPDKKEAPKRKRPYRSRTKKPVTAEEASAKAVESPAPSEQKDTNSQSEKPDQEKPRPRRGRPRKKPLESAEKSDSE